MSHIKKTTFSDRIRGAIKGFKCTPIDTLHMGMEIHRCDQCEHKNPKPPETMVFYICDRKACNPCDNPECKHTTKIEHAKNFKSNSVLGMNNGYSDYWEVDHHEGENDVDENLDKLVRLGDCPIGLFTFSGKVYYKLSNAPVIVHAKTGKEEFLHPDILVWPIEFEEDEDND